MYPLSYQYLVYMISFWGGDDEKEKPQGKHLGDFLNSVFPRCFPFNLASKRPEHGVDIFAWWGKETEETAKLI